MTRTVPLLLLFLAAGATAALAGEKRVYRVDSVSASLADGAVVITAKGAVQSGGWKKPRLRLTRSDAHTLIVELLAQTPDSNQPVIEGLMPVQAKLRVRGRQGMLAVKALGEANEVTAQILRPGP